MSGATTPSLSASTPTLYDPADMSNERTHLLGKQKGIDPISPIQTYSNGLTGSQVEQGAEAEDGEEIEVYLPGKASFSQTLLNVLGDLIGTGLLATPIAIAHAGWVLGPIFLCIICAVTLWTLKILIRIIEKDRRMRNFADVARFGLGEKAEKWITGLFVGDCCLWLIALIVLFSDTMEAVWPVFSSNQWKLVGLAVIIPLNFVPLRYLSYTSFIGVLSTWTLVCILIFTGLSNPSKPGSIFDPEPTDLFPPHGFIKLGISFGLLISGFGGHFLVPNLIRDMKRPEQADRVVEVAYGICMCVYILVAVFGYLMFGRDVSDEISRDLAKTSAFSPTMAKIAVWMVALNPLTKLPLALRPLCDVIYTWCHLQPTIYLPHKHTPDLPAVVPTYTIPESNSASTSPITPTFASRTSSLTIFPEPDTISNSPSTSKYKHQHPTKSIAELKHDRKEFVKQILRPLISIVMILLFIIGSFILPSFETVMGIMGGGLSVINCILIPISAGAGIFGWTRKSKIIFGLSCAVAVVGTICPLMNGGNVSAFLEQGN